MDYEKFWELLNADDKQLLFFVSQKAQLVNSLPIATALIGNDFLHYFVDLLVFIFKSCINK